MEAFWVKNLVTYDGSQLRPLYSYLEHGILGDSVLGWRGACDIPVEKIVDGEDLRAQARICGSDMLHFIVELFNQRIFAAVSVQRLLVCIAKDLAMELSPQASGLFRKGDDLYLGPKKFNISIASVSPISAMIHIAFNVSTLGTPVQTLGLEELGVSPDHFAEEFLKRVSLEVASVERATKKVRPLA